MAFCTVTSRLGVSQDRSNYFRVQHPKRARLCIGHSRKSYDKRRSRGGHRVEVSIGECCEIAGNDATCRNGSDEVTAPLHTGRT